jgi:ATP-binding cassette subfamily B protein
VRGGTACGATPQLDQKDASARANANCSLARVVLIQPSILVLDEATSSVDTRTEVMTHRAMAGLRTGRTGVVIAHRLSTIHDTDTILVMEAGRVVEQGRREEPFGGR